MNKLIPLFCLAISAMTLFAQSANNEDEVIKIDKANRYAYRPNEVIVKFREDGAVRMSAPRKARFATSQVNAVDALFAEIGVDSVEELMPLTGSKPMPRKLRTFSGKDIDPKNLGKLYRLKLSETKAQNVHQVVEQLQQLSEVDFAEPNYLVYALDAQQVGEEVAGNGNGNNGNNGGGNNNDPLYSEQHWWLNAIGLPDLWKKPIVRSKCK